MSEIKISAKKLIAKIVDDYMSKCEAGTYTRESFLDYWVTELGNSLKVDTIDIVIFALAYSAMSDLICDFSAEEKN